MSLDNSVLENIFDLIGTFKGQESVILKNIEVSSIYYYSLVATSISVGAYFLIDFYKTAKNPSHKQDSFVRRDNPFD